MMLHYDCLHHPSANAASQQQRGKGRGPTSTSNNASHISYLETHTYRPVSTEEMEQVIHHCLYFKHYSKGELIGKMLIRHCDTD